MFPARSFLSATAITLVAALATACSDAVTNPVPALDPFVTSASVAVSEVPPGLSVTPSQLDFGSVPVGSYADLTFTITNTSGIPVAFADYWLIAGSGGEFVYGEQPAEGSCLEPYRSLAVGESCVAAIRFLPAEGGASEATFMLDTEPGRVTLALSGIGDGGAVRFAPSLLDLGDVVIGSTRELGVSIQNPGTQAVAVYDALVMQSGAEFRVTRGEPAGCPDVIEAGAACTVYIKFAPTALGYREARYVLHTSVGEASVALSGSGLGTSATLVVTPMTFAFGNVTVGTTADASITIMNPTSQAVVMGAPGLIGSNAAEFSAVSLSPAGCGTSDPIPAWGSCVLTMRFGPTAPGSRVAALILSSTLGTVTVPLSGTGVAAGTGSFTLGPASLDFGLQPVGIAGPAGLATLLNTGTLPLQIQDASLVGSHASDFALDAASTTCGTELAAGSSCTYGVAFTAAATGLRAATLNVQTNYGLGSVSLSGSGQAAAQSDLSIAMGGSSSTAQSGKRFTYSLTVHNAGPGVASGITITDIIPATTTFRSVAAPAGVVCTTPPSGSTGAVQCSAASLAAGQSLVIRLEVNMLSGGHKSVSNTATVSSSSGDPNLVNNAATLAVTVRGRK